MIRSSIYFCLCIALTSTEDHWKEYFAEACHIMQKENDCCQASN